MLILFGDACKRASLFSKLDKTYTATLTLGAETVTGDAEGEPQPISDRAPTREEIEAALPHFVGEITQTPSAYSAIKINGQEAYKRARAGQEFEMPSRLVTIYSVEILHYEYPKLVLTCNVSSGTYIRSLAQDLGRLLGVGGYLSGLERTRVGSFSLANALSKEEQDPVRVLANLQNPDQS
jgi:tRNA pseudouridine55 synthase